MASEAEKSMKCDLEASKAALAESSKQIHGLAEVSKNVVRVKPS